MYVFSKQLQVKTWNNLKTAWELVKYIWRCTLCAPIITVYTSTLYSNSSHVRRNCDPSTFATPCEIRSRRDCGVEVVIPGSST
jgi:hypothetical protein